MTRELLQTILTAREEFTAADGAFTANEDTTVEVLFATGSAPVPIQRVASITLHDAFVTVDTDTSTYCLVSEDIVGIKLTHRKETGARTGFRR